MEQPFYNPLFPLVNFLWLFLLLAFLLIPFWRRFLLSKAREALIRQLEGKRGSRVITLIHRQESLGFFGIPIFRYINIEDSEQVLRAIRMTPPEMPIDLIVHTPGGLALASTQIANALVRHKGPVRVIVPHYAMSGGTLLALSADEIIMDPNAVLGPVDPQIGQMPAASILKVLEQKDIKDIEDQTLIMADIARKAIDQMKSYLLWLLTQNGMEEGKAERIAQELATGKYTHDYPLTVEYLKELGLNVSTDVPEEVYALMELFPQPMGSQVPSVQYIPVPYRTNHGGKP
ncbi:ATP-dependent Clp protease proteolytic subunit [Hydrogenobacter sp. T-2]|uniref:SDH family Clp fold serine proteinase n=1 Tax=Pampinifervens diazotrophicum TaxID=1632018 RepID=UPI002B25A793|nr:ATP-dependent Clp protease proteolytic subunit [Hydrogenobacter sp. T-2]WPM32337.1 ATP-dependent Clp protease proteolytic subunit [Hydrogenobacter sp. T-2]